jgi:alkanesulfonate monooxygenase SsuD/methylene tetrahydromethanopterin reductase-like flavin-dependent oxidoreductase (luciferase family)
MLPPTTLGELGGNGGSTSGATGSAAEVAELCRLAEDAGAESLWAVDHLFWPHPMAEAFTTLAVASSATTTCTLGTCVLQLPLRRPAAVAKQATALQLLSGGRFVLGLGIGIHRGEYDRAGVDFGRRGRLMDLGIAEVHRAWDPNPEPRSDYVQQPGSPRVPVWIGGSSVAARRRAAATGDGWVPLFLTPDEYEGALSELRQETVEAGRDPDAVEPAVVVFACVGDDEGAGERGERWLSNLYRLPPKAFRRHLVSGPAERCAAALKRYSVAGARHVVVMVAGSPALEHFVALRQAFAASFAPSTAPAPALVGAPA